ncbi:polysaccharide lyase [Stenotrophomonas sp. GD03908]|uniref:Polysaccharide lyase n=1 Tax=Stenotrophomonas maltophilia TaxID=40324 RepID=A0AAJ2WJ40_STEMA|nr:MULTISPECIES: polysaccharide lyase [Stenotrophomonas]MBH1481916.1 polysaccharide lyase [Stenotrophomonas maltophilia]MDH0979700.1 polysaccharide lyase [Stenotrophomonas sp. GD03908]MDQ7295199.1 polysaccharide lyase [Stenotrophomonas sp. Sm0041]MDZ5763740.1 polysaccharide lyase [Stenotrophomonas maltophilia]
MSLPLLRLALLPTLLASACAFAACPPPPPGQPDIRALGYYTDQAGSVIDPALHQQNKDATAPLDRYAADVARMSDDYLRNGDPAAAQCTLAWLGAWADGGAMLGQMIRVNNDQSFYMRQWMLDAVAMAYLKVHDQADPQQRARIDPWLQQLARANLAYWDNPKRRRNNHYYWGGLGVLATGLATDDDALWQAGHAAFQKGIDDVQDDGSLPLEMARGQRALHYHDYALAPLVMMAELARLRGQDWYASRDHAIDHLARRVIEGSKDPAWFNQHTGVAQLPLRRPSGWVEFYRLRSPDGGLFDAAHARGPFHSPRLGGDLTLMATHGIVRTPLR